MVTITLPEWLIYLALFGYGVTIVLRLVEIYFRRRLLKLESKT